ncbi:thiamine pyrophosphate-binding protein [Zhihengliuella salsuginis]|uniref:Acetolactate synthase n=1 Tax=Zhihengliuella salsuginis TaxID=578222 RepID=A0ABQ3GL07_9MICC|nr:thiamine pyrophosphate-binding protein [Zhihengliuella salsuginis]GHD10456.1 acetolactate synthase [Zhihengliuella salsuginis]
MSRRNGGDLVVEALSGLGARTVFGIPGQHALGLFDALGRSPLHFVSSRVENNAAFAADGFSRATGEVGVLFLSTGPGALTALAGLQEAYATAVPVVVVSSQIPAAGLGGVRKGMLHQLDDQASAAAQVTKSQRTVRTASSIGPAIRAAWAEATTSPQGPVWVEVPQDLLLAETDLPATGSVAATGAAEGPAPAPELLDEASRLLSAAGRPAIIAGGGVRRAGAEADLLRLAEALDAPVICTPGGHGAFPWEHPLSLQSWIEDRHTTDLLEDADVLLAVGTSLGEISSNYFTLAPRGRVVQIDAEARVLESNYPGLGLHADAKTAMEALVSAAGNAPRAASDWHGASAAEHVAATLEAVRARLDAQDLGHERDFMQALRDGVPDSTQTFWDMTIAAYWGWSCWDARRGEFHSGQGAGGLGYGFPAALGAAVGLSGPDTAERVLAVSGDGSAMYSIAELATARQHDADVTWVIIDDGGYGILREYMTDTFGAPTATELARPDFAALAESFGVPARRVAPEGIREALDWAWQQQGPNVIVVPTLLRMFAPTHLG